MEITLSDIEKTDIHTLVSVTVKVMMCEKPSTLGTKTKQNAVVSDHTDSITVQLWKSTLGVWRRVKAAVSNVFGSGSIMA